MSNRHPVLLDDMISSAGTMFSAIKSLLKLGCRTPETVAVIHGLFVGDAVQQLKALPINKIITTNSLPQTNEEALPIETIDISGLLADTINHIRGW